MTSVRHVAMVLGLFAGSASALYAGVPTVIFSNIQTSSSSDVPGMPGFKFYLNPAPQAGPPFGAPFCSPDGQRWILRTLISSPEVAYRAVIVGGGEDGSASAIVLRHNTATFFDGAVNYSDFDEIVGITDQGCFAFSADTNAPTNSDEIVARWTPVAGFELIAREGVQAVGENPGIGYGTLADEVRILADDRVAFRNGGLTGSGGAYAIFVNSAIDDGYALVRSGVTLPAGQLGGAQNTIWSAFRFRTDAAGENYLYLGDIIGAGNIIVFNNVVAAQHGLPLPDGYPGYFTQPDLLFSGLSVAPYNGHFAFRNDIDYTGNGSSDGQVVVVDGRVVAASDQPIHDGATQLFNYDLGGREAAFFLNVVNSDGDFVIGGYTQPGTLLRHVLVHNGRTLLLRQLDPIDLNGDGLPNDGIDARGIDADSAFLADNGRLYFTVELGFGVGEAFVWMPVPKRADPNCDGAIDFFDIDPFLLALFDEAGYAAAYPDCWRITADINRDGEVNFFDIDPFIACLFTVCP